MKLKTICFFVAVLIIFSSCKTTKDVKQAETAEGMETASITDQTETVPVTETPITDILPENDSLDTDNAEVFVSVPEDKYISVNSDNYTDSNAAYNTAESISTENPLEANDYSDDYPAEYTDSSSQSVKTSTNSSAIVFGTPSDIQGETKTGTSSDKASVASDSFYIDYSQTEYNDYSGYNYGDKDYDKLIAKFGPHSFPSDKLIAPGRKNAKQLYDYFVSKNPNGDLTRAKRLAQLYVEECAIEGVNSDLAFIQMCHETGFLRFGNLVTPDMNNFCGLGSISKTNPGLRFESDRMGVRAHVQHLQAYGTNSVLNQTLIDPRYKYVVPKGKAPTLAGLTGSWASDPNYDRKIYLFMKELAHF